MEDVLKVGQYILVRKIGEGGMAEVWEGRHTHLDTRTAVKFLLPEFARNKELQERFMNEGKRQAHLQHPNIVPALDFFQLEGRSYLVMRYVEGESLESRLERTGAPLSLEEIRAISWDVSSALDYSHSLGVIHRDVKPANMLMDVNGSTLLMDFGIAKALREERSVTLTGTAMGTPHYMSPEQIVDPKRVDARSDIYSFGCVLYAMFSGEPPFNSEGATAFHVMSAHVRTAPPPLMYRIADVSHAVGPVVLKCLEKDPAHRYQSCGEVMAALALAIAKTSDPVIPEPHPVEARRRPGTIVESRTATFHPAIIQDPAIIHDAKATTASSINFPGKTVHASKLPSATSAAAPPRAEKASTSSKDMASGMKYLLACLALLVLISGSAYLLLHGKKPEQEAMGRVQRLQSRDWSQVRYDDADFADCMGVQGCEDKKDLADKFKLVSDWRAVQEGDALLKSCMQYAPCTERASQIMASLRAPHAAPSEKAPGRVAAPLPTSQTPPINNRSVEDLPSCCSRDAHPAQCLAIKQREDIRDCASPIGNN